MSDHANFTHRRDFVRGLALGASVSLVATVPALADEPQDEAPADPIEAEIEARMALILARHGSQLDDDAPAIVRDEVAGIVRRAARLRAFPLDNGDGPATVWTPYRAPLA